MSFSPLATPQPRSHLVAALTAAEKAALVAYCSPDPPQTPCHRLPGRAQKKSRAKRKLVFSMGRNSRQRRRRRPRRELHAELCRLKRAEVLAQCSLQPGQLVQVRGKWPSVSQREVVKVSQKQWTPETAKCVQVVVRVPSENKHDTVVESVFAERVVTSDVDPGARDPRLKVWRTVPGVQSSGKTTAQSRLVVGRRPRFAAESGGCHLDASGGVSVQTCVHGWRESVLPEPVHRPPWQVGVSVHFGTCSVPFEVSDVQNYLTLRQNVFVRISVDRQNLPSTYRLPAKIDKVLERLVRGTQPKTGMAVIEECPSHLAKSEGVVVGHTQSKDGTYKTLLLRVPVQQTLVSEHDVWAVEPRCTLCQRDLELLHSEQKMSEASQFETSLASVKSEHSFVH